MNKLNLIGLIALTAVSFVGCSKKKASKKISHVATVAQQKVENMDLGRENYTRTIYFDLNKSSLTADAKNTLDSHLDFLRTNPDATIIIEGHADITGSAMYNQKISNTRANAVKNYYEHRGISSNRITVQAYGQSQADVYATQGKGSDRKAVVTVCKNGYSVSQEDVKHNSANPSLRKMHH